MRKRSSYRPKPVNPLAHRAVMMGACYVARDDAIQMGLDLADAVERASRGQASQQDWRLVFDRINEVEALADMGLLQGQDVIEGVQDAMAVALDRHMQTGTRALRAGELAALRGFAADYAAIIGGVTYRELAQAQRNVVQRIARLIRQPDPSVRVVVAP